MSRMTTGALDQLVASASDRFLERYQRQPHWIVAAPGRVNLIGEHIDYNDGFVLPMAIERYCVIAAAAASGESAKIFSVAADEEATVPLASAKRNPMPGHWSNYSAGVIALCGNRNMRPGGFEAVVDSSVPFGGGLSSSAAIEVATATLIEVITGTSLDPVAKALLCQKAEHDYAGVPCGIMDMFASTMGRADHLMLLDCRSRQIEHIPLVDPSVSVLIVNTNVKHELSDGEYAQRRGQCESAARKLDVSSLRDVSIEQLGANHKKLDATELRRARHAVTEIARTVDAAAAVKAGDWPRVGYLMYASHESLRDDYEVSCEELDLLVELARKIGPAGGVIGSRMTGGGFGGCTVSLVGTANVGAVAEKLAQAYRAKTSINPSIIVSRPARGAHIVKSVA
jgi:galactokinase